MGGLLCTRDLRIPVSTALGQLAARHEAREILEDFACDVPKFVTSVMTRDFGGPHTIMA